MYVHDLNHHPLLQEHPYQLSEDGMLKLHDLRDQLLFLASLTIVNTHDEENALLEVRRAMLGECFERFALQIGEVISGMSSS